MEYLFILLLLLLLLLLSFLLEWRFHIHLYQSRKERIIIPIIFFIIGTIWDTLAVYRGHWYFNFSSTRLLGIKIGLLPLEEYLFFLVIPYFVLTLYKFLKREI